MKVARTAAEVLESRVTMEIECIDRLYLNLYVPILQRPEGCGHFFIRHRGHKFASTALMAPMTRDFVKSIERFATRESIEIVRFKKGERKEDVAKARLDAFDREEGVLFIGKAQEKVPVIRTERRHNPRTGASYPWMVKSSAMVNQYYFYCVDRDFGMFFLKLSSYFPYNGKVCLNGHEYLKCQLSKKGIEHEALDNGLLSCADPRKAQQICDQLDSKKIERLVRKWLAKLPHPFTEEDQKARYCHDISILQAEFSLTQVLERPLDGRIFLEQVIRDNLDIGRPDQVKLVFDRRITRKTPGRFRTRVITEGVHPTLYIDYKTTRIKQYHKEGRALRTETTINNTYDFGIGKRLKNLPALRGIGNQANRRLLDVQRISHDASLGEENFSKLQTSRVSGAQRAAALRFADPRVLALFSALVIFRFLPRGFSNRDMREHVAPLRGLTAEQLSPGSMTYDLRRLRIHGLIEKIPKTRRYKVTDKGIRTALFCTRSYNRLLRPGFAAIGTDDNISAPIKTAILRFDKAVDRVWRSSNLAA